MPGEGTVAMQNYEENRCSAFLKDSKLMDAFVFPIKLMCNPNSTEDALNLMVKKAEELGDQSLANQACRRFTNMYY